MIHDMQKVQGVSTIPVLIDNTSAFNIYISVINSFTTQEIINFMRLRILFSSLLYV